MTVSMPTLAAPARRPWSGLDWALLGVTCFVTLAIYFQTRSFGFINYDDYVYVSENQHVLAGLSVPNIKWASTAIVAANWHPLTLYLELILSSLFGPRAGTFHLANSILHVINAGLLFGFLRYATGRSWPAFFTAILWAWHPLRAESVAWVSELKDVLCGFFFLGCLIAYVRYSRRRTVGGYLAVAALLAAALLSKPMAVTLPAVLLLLDYWPGGEGVKAPPLTFWLTRVVEKLPLLALSIADIACALVTQQNTHSIGNPLLFPLSLRLRNAAVSTVYYLRDTFWPLRLGLFHPHPVMIGQTVGWAPAIASAVLLLGITALALLRRGNRYLIVGWLWFLGMLTPVIGFIQVGEQARADRYTYLPSIGLTFAVVWLVADWTARWAPMKNRIAAASAVAAGIAVAVLAHGDVSYWKDSLTLFTRSAETIPDNYLALSVEADVARSQGDPQRALALAAEAFRIAPDSTAPVLTYGGALVDLGRLDEAEAVTRRGIEKANRTYQLWDLLGAIRDEQANRAAAAEGSKVPAGHPRSAVPGPAETDFRAKALNDFTMARRTAAASGVDYPIADYHIAHEQIRSGQLADGIAGLEKVLDVDPVFRPAHTDLADALWLEATIDTDLARTLSETPFPSQLANARSGLIARSGPLLEQAVIHYVAAYKLGDREPDIETRCAWLVATNGGYTTAQVEAVLPAAQDAVAQAKNDPFAFDALAAVYARVGQIDAAITAAQSARDAALAAGKPQLAAQIAGRLRLYQQGKIYLFGDEQP
jgi:tetratricopeptide (TPR) repeat protein